MPNSSKQIRALRQTKYLFVQRLGGTDILECLHERTPPVVHRDFTPENLILNDNGSLTLIDFDVARQEHDATRTVTVVGKPPYMPAEQLRGKPTVRSDIYALGATMHFLLSGSEPEPLTVSEPRMINDHVSEGLNTVIKKCTALNEEDRYQHVAEVARGFHRALADGVLSEPNT